MRTPAARTALKRYWTREERATAFIAAAEERASAERAYAEVDATQFRRLDKTFEGCDIPTLDEYDKAQQGQYVEPQSVEPESVPE